MGNYNSYGSLKFVPELKEESFAKILRSNPLYKQPQQGQKPNNYKTLVDETWSDISKDVYAFTTPYKQLGFPEEGGVTAYFGRNLKKDDLKLVKEFLDHEKIDVLNTRAFKTEEGKYIITVGSIDTNRTKYNMLFKGKKFDIEYGEFSPYLKELNSYLEQAIPFTSNEN